MFSSHIKIKISKALYQRLEEKVAMEGYSSVDELIALVLQKAAGSEVRTDDEDVDQQLRGLGYLE